MLVVDCPQTCSSSVRKLKTDSNTMPFGRSKRTLRSTLRHNQIEANGDAWLCFAKDHSWFQGNINTDDESNYSLYGEKRKETQDLADELIENQLLELDISGSDDGEGDNNNIARRDSRSSESTESTSSSDDGEENNNMANKKNPGSKLLNSSSANEYYSVILTDHFSGLRYQLPRIYVNKEQSEDGTEEKNLFICADGQISFQVDRVFKGQKADMMIQQHIGSPTLLGQRCLVYNGPMSIIFNESLMENERSWCL